MGKASSLSGFGWYSSRTATSRRPPAGPRQRRHEPAHGADTRPVTTTPSLRLSRVTSTSTAAPAGTDESSTTSPSDGTSVRTSWRVAGWRRSSATLRSSGRDSATGRSPPVAILVEERRVALLLLGIRLWRLAGRHPDGQLLATGSHRLGQAVEEDLEAGQALIDEVLRLVAHLLGGGLCLFHDAPGALIGSAHHLGPLHHALGLSARRVEDVVGLATRLDDELVALLQHAASLAQILGQAVERL